MTDRKIIDYKMCQASNSDDLSNYVKILIDKGYEPYGVPLVTTKMTQTIEKVEVLSIINQAMVKYGELENGE